MAWRLSAPDPRRVPPLEKVAEYAAVRAAEKRVQENAAAVARAGAELAAAVSAWKEAQINATVVAKFPADQRHASALDSFRRADASDERL